MASSAQQKMNFEETTKKGQKMIVGILAGSGQLPVMLLDALDQKQTPHFIIAFENQTDPKLVADRPHLWVHLGAVGRIMDTLSEHKVTHVVMAGAIKRPTFTSLKLDGRGMKFLARLGLKGLGDDGLLRAIAGEFEEEGFEVIGPDFFMKDVFAEGGALTEAKPNAREIADIERGIEVLEILSAADIGQALIVQEGIILAVEAAEGTDELILRSQKIQKKGDQKPILVKGAKIGQDGRLDRPTIGPDTIKNCAKAGIQGIAVEAHQTFIVDQKNVFDLAKQKGIFIYGFTRPEIDAN